MRASSGSVSSSLSAAQAQQQQRSNNSNSPMDPQLAIAYKTRSALIDTEIRRSVDQQQMLEIDMNVSATSTASGIVSSGKSLVEQARTSIHMARDMIIGNTSGIMGQPIGKEEGTGAAVQQQQQDQQGQQLDKDDKEIIQDVKQYKYHTLSVEQVCETLGTDIKKGLTEKEAKERLDKYGANTLKVRDYRWILRFIGQYVGDFGLILWPASVLCILAYKPFGSPPDPNNIALAVILWLVIFAQGTMNNVQEWSTRRVMNSINKIISPMSTVLRDGAEVQVVTSKLVPGDIVRVESGMRVPADLRLFSVNGLKVDSSILTGESEAITCSIHCTDNNYMETKNLLFCGASVVEGSGFGIVVNTGNKTVMGKIARLAGRSSQGSSTLRKQIFRFVSIIVAIAAGLALLLLVFWLAYLRTAFPNFMSTSAMLANMIGLVVAFVPEGIPVSLSLTLIILAKRMLKHNVLVKKLPTIETLGAVDVICSDKTGTLTQNKMSVAFVYSANRLLNTTEEPTASQECFRLFEAGDRAFLELVTDMVLCNRANFQTGSQGSATDSTKTIVGDATDSAMLQFGDQFLRVSSTRAQYKKLAEIPFNSRNKFMLTVVKDTTGSAKVLMKGAAEQILERCVTVLTSDSSEQILTDVLKQELLSIQEGLCNKGHRVLAIGMLELDRDAFDPDTFTFNVEERNFPMDGLCLVGFVSLVDPPRVDVPSAIQTCRGAGIHVSMVTGDHPSTAVAIAQRVGIVGDQQQVVPFAAADKLQASDVPRGKHKFISTQALVIKGVDVPMFDKTQWNYICAHKELVFARTTPENKLTIVREFQRRKHIVAVTGDGVNDAPALKQAQVGVAMGAGSEVAKEAADIVLMDSKFSSIVVGIENGRLAFDNIRKVILYLMPSGMWSEMLPIWFNAFLGVPLPLSSFLMIVICVLTDIAPSLSLIMESPESNLMKRPPLVRTGESLVNIWLFVQAFLFFGMIESITGFMCFFLYMYWHAGLGPSDLFLAFDKWTDGYKGYTQTQLNDFNFTGQSVYFAAIVLVQFANLHSTRTRRMSYFQMPSLWGKSRNLFIYLAIVISISIALFVVYLPGIQDIFNTRPVPIEFWFLPLAFGLALFTLDEVRKLLIRVIWGLIGKLKQSSKQVAADAV